MAKTYTLAATSINGGRRNTWSDIDWNGYTSDSRKLAGRQNGAFYATNILFNASTLASLRSKTITSVSLELTLSYSAGSQYSTLLIGYKKNNGTTADNSWQRTSKTDQAGEIGAHSAISSATKKNYTLATTIPSYGYVVGPSRETLGTNSYIEISSATLTVVTNETDYTLSYNANSGSGAPSAQTGTGSGSYTFTISDDAPTRAGHTFLGWATSASATTASYQPGGSITISANTTLYAVWQLITYTVSYNANGGSGAPGSQTKQHGVALTLSSTRPTRTGYTFIGWATSANGSVAYQPGGSYTSNAAVTLYAKWAAASSTLSSVSSAVIGTTNGGSASWNVLNSAYTYKLVLTFGNAPAVTVNVAANTSSTSFTIPNTWLQYLPASTSATATAALTTYSGTTALGTSTKTFTITVASSVKPAISSFSVSHYSANSAVSGWGVFTQGYSRADLSVSATAGSGASIASITFSGPGVSQTGTGTTVRSAVLTTPGTNSFSVTVKDTRGRSSTSGVSVIVYPYAPPVISAVATERSDAQGNTDNGTGTYLKVKPVYSISSVNSRNSITVQTIKYTEHGSSTSLGSKTCASGTTYGPTGTMWAVSITKSYDVTVTVKDAVGNQTVYTTTLPGAAGLWYGKGNDRLGLGSPPPGPGLYSDWPAYFKDTVDILPRRCYATLTSAGWYRVMKYTADNQNLALGMVGAVIDFTLTRQRSSSGEDNHSIKMMMVKDDVVFRDEVSHSLSGYQRLTKIRYTNVGNIGYVDIYYAGGTSHVSVDFVVHTRPEIQSAFTAESLQAASTGETLVVEHSFSAETRGYATATKDSNFSASTFTLTATRRGDFIVYYFNIRVPALTAATETTMGTFSTLKPPSGFNLTTCGQSGGAFLIQFKVSGAVTIYATNATTEQFVRGSFVIPA